jgi:DNA (cytosine-5)-methyltransferase 1
MALETTKNKGEWTELLVFIKLLLEQKFYLSDETLNAKNTYFKIWRHLKFNLPILIILFPLGTKQEIIYPS